MRRPKVELSPAESTAVYSALIPGFRLDKAGRYRGRAAYRDGDNPSALSVNISLGWKDFVTDEGGDVIAFVQKALGADFKRACKAISEIIGRDVLGEGSYFPPKRLRKETRDKAARLRTALPWIIDRHLVALKQALFDRQHDQVVAAAVLSLTSWRAAITKWSDEDAADAMAKLSRRVPGVVKAAIAEAAEAEIQLAKAIAGVSAEEADAA